MGIFKIGKENIFQNIIKFKDLEKIDKKWEGYEYYHNNNLFNGTVHIEPGDNRGSLQNDDKWYIEVVNGKGNGHFRKWNSSNQLLVEGEYKNGVHFRDYKNWDESGKLLMDTYYNQQKDVFIVTELKKNFNYGELKIEQEWSHNNEELINKVVEREYIKEKIIISEKSWSENKIQYKKTFDETGQLESINDGRTITEFYKNGIKKSEFKSLNDETTIDSYSGDSTQNQLLEFEHTSWLEGGSVSEIKSPLKHERYFENGEKSYESLKKTFSDISCSVNINYFSSGKIKGVEVIDNHNNISLKEMEWNENGEKIKNHEHYNKEELENEKLILIRITDLYSDESYYLGYSISSLSPEEHTDLLENSLDVFYEIEVDIFGTILDKNGNIIEKDEDPYEIQYERDEYDIEMLEKVYNEDIKKFGYGVKEHCNLNDLKKKVTDYKEYKINEIKNKLLLNKKIESYVLELYKK